MKLIDSSVWIEHLTAGPRLPPDSGLFAEPDRILVPAVVLCEVGRYVGRTSGPAILQEVMASMQSCRLAAVDAEVARTAIDLAAAHRLATADALIAATAHLHSARIVTFDADLLRLPGSSSP